MQERNRQLNNSCGRNQAARRLFARLTATVAAFGTVFMLATPAFALNLTGKLLHTHNEFCRNSEGTLVCPLAELEEHEHSDRCYEAAAPEHIHEDSCYTMERGALICTEDVQEGHVHTDACYEETVHEHTAECYTKQKGELICTLPEREGHSHASACYAPGQTLICQVEENETHTHDASCYEKVVKCEIPEEAGHTHSDACFAWKEVLSCTARENSAAPEKNLVCTEKERHIHGDACYEWTKKLSCAMEELPADGTEPERVLVCTRTELKNHIHVAACYKTGRLGKGKLVCKQTQLRTHQHTRECLDFTDAELICKKNESAEHRHDHLCYRSWTYLCRIEADGKSKSDPAADVETPEVWEKTFENVKLTGAWPHDLLAIAQTQLGYEESERNFVYEDGERRGYTRYGEWYGGVQYGDWCAMFIAFCMHYAGVEGVPVSCSCERWIDFLEEAGMYVPADSYTPRPGDLVFFDSSRSLLTPETAPIESDHVAIVTEMIPATQQEPAAVVTLEGNYYNCVRYETRYLDDPRIIGYGLLPDGPSTNYSCGLQAHTHGDGCYDAESLICKIQPHTHVDACRTHKLQYEDASVRVDVLLSDAMYLPADLSLRAALVTEDDPAAYRAMVDAVDAAIADMTVTERNSLFCRLQLLSGGQPCELPAGVRADVQVSFKKTAFTAKATLETAQRHIFLLVEEVPEEAAATTSYQVVELTGGHCRNGDDGIAGVSFAANRISAFSVIVDVPRSMTPRHNLQQDLIA